MDTSWGMTFTRKKYKTKRIDIFNETGDTFNITIDCNNEVLKGIVNCLEDGSQCEVKNKYTSLTLSKYNMVIEYFDLPITFKVVLDIDTYKDVLIKGFSEWLE